MNIFNKNIVFIIVLSLSLLTSCRVRTVLCSTAGIGANERYSNDTTERYVFDWRTNNELVITHKNAHNSSCRKAKVFYSGDTLYVRESTKTAPLETLSSWSCTIPIEERNYIIVKTDLNQVFPVMKRDTSVTSFPVLMTRIKKNTIQFTGDNIIGKWFLKEEYDKDGYICKSGNYAYKPNGNPVNWKNRLPVEKLYINIDMTWQYYVGEVLKDCGILTTTKEWHVYVCEIIYDLDLEKYIAINDDRKAIFEARKAKNFTSHIKQSDIAPFGVNISMFYGQEKNQRIFFMSLGSELLLKPQNEDECLPQTGNLRRFFRLKNN